MKKKIFHSAEKTFFFSAEILIFLRMKRNVWEPNLADEICPDRTDCRCAEAKGIQCVLRPARENRAGSAVLGLGRKYANLG